MKKREKMLRSLPFPTAWATTLVLAQRAPRENQCTCYHPSRKPGPLIQYEFLSLKDF